MRHAANALTALRLVLALPVATLLLVESPTGRIGAVALFVIAGLTDVLDGAIARRTGTVSALGALLDPLADKCLVNGALLVLAARDQAPLALVSVLVLRDAGVMTARLLKHEQGSLLAPSRLAKRKTFILHLAVPCLALGAMTGAWLSALGWILLLLALGLSLVSAVKYARRLRGSAPIPPNPPTVPVPPRV